MGLILWIILLLIICCSVLHCGWLLLSILALCIVAGAICGIKNKK